MTPTATTPFAPPPADLDLADQALPGHGIPSQDPDNAAQLPMEAGEAEREAQSVLVGGGMVEGMATGATIGELTVYACTLKTTAAAAVLWS